MTPQHETPHVASLDRIRDAFPALARRDGGRTVAYFDGPGGTQVPRAVADAMIDYLYHHNANTHWAYPTSAETDDALDHAREVFAAFLRGRPEEIAFGANMTALTMHVARGLARAWSRGDEVVVTELDHHGNVAPWVEAARDFGLVVRTVRMIPETGQLDWDHFAHQVTHRTRLVAVGAASNALGTVSDLARAKSLARHVGALLFVDGVHFAPHELPDIEAIGCDGFVCSAYKFYGPHVGVLWLRRDLLAATDLPRLIPASHDPPERAETGTLNHEGVVGAAAAVEWLSSLATGPATLRERLAATYDTLHAKSQAQVHRLWDGLAAIAGVRLYGPPPEAPRTPTVGFTVADVPSEEVARQLATQGVYCSHGDFYAHTVIERLGLQPHGLVRAGCACYTSEEDVDRLLHGIATLKTRTLGAVGSK
jgi:cysteine desulfurase family protein (TIGR01976 family)